MNYQTSNPGVLLPAFCRSSARLRPMIGPVPSPPKGDPNCWQCGAPACAGCAYSLLLVANPRWGLTGAGHLVKRGERLDEVRVRVPRCADCRFRSGISVVKTFVSAIAGAIVIPVVGSRLWPDVDGLHPGNSGLADGMTIIGVVLGFVVAMLGIALHRRFAGLRPLTTYPPVIRLRKEGWHFPVSSSE
jgi:hypothetical protein